MCSLEHADDLDQPSPLPASWPVHVREAFVNSDNNRSVTVYVWKPLDKTPKYFSHPRQKRSCPQGDVADGGNPGGAAVPVVGMTMPTQASWSSKTFCTGVWL